MACPTPEVQNRDDDILSFISWLGSPLENRDAPWKCALLGGDMRTVANFCIFIFLLLSEVFPQTLKIVDFFFQDNCVGWTFRPWIWISLDLSLTDFSIWDIFFRNWASCWQETDDTRVQIFFFFFLKMPLLTPVEGAAIDSAASMLHPSLNYFLQENCVNGQNADQILPCRSLETVPR